ncbi:hypothetical protein GCM10022409_41420 [Hymenobacter glaciei]|uniref:Uncharacterized protein n=2 Tax=Hymenobacter glaciei TaxID=877209 RepID=A0ABP7UQY8_9BACT
MEGFYGPANYRVSFFFTKVVRDEQHPDVYHIWGKNRYKKVITPFTGTCTFKQLTSLPDTTDLARPETGQPSRGYSVIGDYTITEDPTTKGAGVYSGKVMLDFFLTASGKAVLAWSEPLMEGGMTNPSKGSGLLFQGVWRDNKTGQIKAASWSSDFSVIIPETLEKMGLGSRGDTIYPELAKYGWNELYENNEWWAKPTKPAMSL